ncbi:MAG TPA: LysR family transcriptional regulator [Verrucomicrobiae bacterium]|nr:LysR family transcriptional regulator [Verrucomicrobiae bacterium]
MNLRRLRYFREIGICGSFTAAAASLNVSQPALTYHLKQLEAELGVALLERHARGIRVTKAGEKLLSHLDAVFDQLAKIDEIVAPFRVGRTTTVRLGVTPTAGRVIGPSLLAAYGKKPSPQIILYERLTGEILKAFAAKEIDAALSYETPGTLSFSAVPLYSEDLFLVGPLKLVDRSDGDVSFSKLADFPLLLDRRLNLTRELIERVASERGVRLNYALEIEPNSIKRELMLKHQHCSVVPYGFMRDEIDSGLIGARKLREPTLTCTLMLLFKDGLSEQIRGFLEQNIAAIVATKIKDGYGWRSAGNDPVRRSSSVTWLGNREQRAAIRTE